MAELINIKELNEQLQLKPSFKVEVPDVNIVDQFSVKKDAFNNTIVIKRLDEHVWLSIPKKDRKYFSPRLHIEIEQKEQSCVLHCTFWSGPRFMDHVYVCPLLFRIILCRLLVGFIPI